MGINYVVNAPLSVVIKEVPSLAARAPTSQINSITPQAFVVGILTTGHGSNSGKQMVGIYICRTWSF